MKKILLICLLIAAVATLAACGDRAEGNGENDPSTHTHSFGEWEVIKSATCTEEGVKARYCDCSEKQSENVPATGHTEVINEAIAPSCIKAGLTEGKHCSVCGEVIIKQGTEPVIAHSYDDEYDDSCNVCGGIRDT